MFYILDELGNLARTATSIPDKAGLQAAGYTVIESELDLDIENIDIQGFPQRPIAVQRQATALPRVVLTTNAEDADGDGVPEIPADGRSKGSVRVFLRDAKGVVKKAVDVSFQVSAGSLSQRAVTTKDGKAMVQFVAGTETVTAVIRASAEGFEPGYLRFELIPKEPLEA